MFESEDAMTRNFMVAALRSFAAAMSIFISCGDAIAAPEAWCERPPCGEAREFWKKTVEFVSQPRGGITGKRFERIFSMRFSETRVESNGSVHHDEYPKDFNGIEIALDEYGADAHVDSRAGLTIGLQGAEFRALNGGDCIAIDHAKETLAAAGWAFTGIERRSFFNFKTSKPYVSGDLMRLTATADGRCVQELSMLIAR